MIKNSFRFTGLLVIIFNYLCVSKAWSATDEWMQIHNAPSCAAEMSKPTSSLLLAATIRDLAIMMKELAPQLNKEPVPFIQEGNRLFKIKLNRLSEKIIMGLDSGQLPYVTENKPALMKESWSKLSNQTLLKTIDSIQCYQVNDINSYYSHLFIRGVNQSTLEELAKQFLNNSSRIKGCRADNIAANTDLYPVFNYDLNLKNTAEFEKNGFAFWASFKIYLSWAWRNIELEDVKEGPYKAIFKAAPIEEQVLLLSNGCKSLTKPECQSDFLSSTEMRSLFTTDRKKLDLTSSTLEMRDNLIDNNDSVDQKVNEQMAAKSKDNEWIRSFQKSYLGFTQAYIEKLNQTNKVFSSIVAQKKTTEIKKDLKLALLDKSKAESLYYMCAESRLIGQEKPLSVFKFDLDFMHQNASKLNQFLKYGLTTEEMISIYDELAVDLQSLCDQFDQKLSTDTQMNENWNNYRPWYKSYLSRYKILQNYLDLDTEEKKQLQLEQTFDQNYVQKTCVDSIDCARKIIEGMVTLNKVLLHSKTFFRTSLTSTPLFNSRAEKVACGLYDPWEASRLNSKKLLADVGSSLLFGWTNLPIYLDINYLPKGQPTSLNKLIENGQVKFDVGFDKNEIQKTLVMNFGSFLNVPCSISLSQTSSEGLNTDSSQYVFKGLTMNACKSQKSDSVNSSSGQIDSFKKTPSSNYSACGQCSINFEQTAQFITDKTFAPLRFVLRLTQSLMRYNAVKNDDSINPRQFNINTKYLTETYNKYHSIPEHCVPLLTRGLRCQSNLCEALAVKEFEQKSGLTVDQVELTKSDATSTEYETAYFKVKGCSSEIRIPTRCSQDGDNFFMSYQKRFVQKCQNEVLK